MRGDDAFGPFVCESLQKYSGPCFLPLNGGELPENFTSKIKAFAPDCLIIADAAFLPGKPAGSLQIIEEKLIANPGGSTHSLPLSIMFKFLKEDLPCLKIVFIACAASNTAFGKRPGHAVTAAAEETAKAIIKAIG
jgi:hydrogenase 3 maturation protease